MDLRCHRLNLPYLHPFGISRWTKTGIENIVVELSDGALTGFGEGAPNKRYDESQETGIQYLESIDPKNLVSLESLRHFLDVEQSGDLSGKAASVAALDIAYFDLKGKIEKASVAQLFGLKTGVGPVTSFTIAIDSLDVIKTKTLEASSYGVLKVKLGTEQDQEIIECIRSVSDQVIRVDANEGWKNPETALKQIDWLSKKNVELIEQPLPAGSFEDVAWIRERSELPLFADEDFKDAKDFAILMECYDGVNVKIDKSGGLRPSRKLIESAKEVEMMVMVGCMGSSSLSITAAAHISLDADFLDLDGHLLLAKDAFEGVYLDEGRIALKDSVGLGVKKR